MARRELLAKDWPSIWSSITRSGRIRRWVTGRRRRSILTLRLFHSWTSYGRRHRWICRLPCKGQPVGKGRAPPGLPHLSTGTTTTATLPARSVVDWLARLDGFGGAAG